MNGMNYSFKFPRCTCVDFQKREAKHLVCTSRGGLDNPSSSNIMVSIDVLG